MTIDISNRQLYRLARRLARMNPDLFRLVSDILADVGICAVERSDGFIQVESMLNRVKRLVCEELMKGYSNEKKKDVP